MALLLVLADGTVSRIEGLLLLAGLVAYTSFTLVQGRRAEVVPRHDIEEAGSALSLPRSILLVVVGLVALVAGGRLFLEAAIELARLVGLSEAVIGLTIVAIGTSLPELVTSVVAALRAQGDIAVGNVLGSNVFNILGILGISAVAAPMTTQGVGWMSLWMMVASAVAVLLLGAFGARLSRLDGGLLVGAYALYVGWLVLGG